MNSELQQQAQTQPQGPTSNLPRPAGPGAIGEGIAGSFQQMAALIGRFADVARADACIGPVQNINGHTVIPIASVSLQAGFGLGYGGGEGGEGNAQGQGGGGGGGGGGRASSRLTAVVDVSETGVSVRPVPDITTIVLGLLALIGVAFLTTRRASGSDGKRLLSVLKQQA